MSMQVYSPKRHRRAPKIAEDNSVYSTVNSAKTPSIIELENLRYEHSQEYIVDTMPTPNSLTYRPLPAVQMKKTYQPHTTPRWEDRKKTTVYVTVTFLKLGEIDTIKEYFEADVYIQARWREPLLDNTKTTVSDYTQFWNPELVLQNVFEDPKEQVWHEVRHMQHGEAFIYEMRRVKGKFMETMELNDFPFDVQGISMVLSSELTKDVLTIVEDKDEISTIYVDCFSDSQEWELYNFVEMDPLDISAQYTRARISYPGIIATCCVSRRAGFFAWNVLVIVNLLTIFAFTTFAVDPTLTQNRLQLSFILMLAAISFRFVTNQSIPKISYLTHLDRYVLVSMMFSGIITFWHAVLSRFKYDASLQSKMDFYAFILFAIGYFFFQMIFILVMLRQRQQKLSEIQKRENKYKFKAQNTVGDVWKSIKSNVASGAFTLGLRNKSNVHTRPR
ncbi:acetylcholine-gated ion channel acc-4-like [Ruditapes philippinarum]|uniref:acetylcholine-gated ion channel acc-4-like n=1 Tax=Ruditapes philippinarum TaxID=129788 RepID=UPI00295BD0AC|nr:acetylcholine-gated ion channel acc-4-like [Ruditapes philippinarum]XP_060558062.1 acetylcholine-gated ion channel acc-4-like [Ruditapes philippinarum]